MNDAEIISYWIEFRQRLFSNWMTYLGLFSFFVLFGFLFHMNHVSDNLVSFLWVGLQSIIDGITLTLFMVGTGTMHDFVSSSHVSSKVVKSFWSGFNYLLAETYSAVFFSVVVLPVVSALSYFILDGVSLTVFVDAFFNRFVLFTMWLFIILCLSVPILLKNVVKH